MISLPLGALLQLSLMMGIGTTMRRLYIVRDCLEKGKPLGNANYLGGPRNNRLTHKFSFMGYTA